jgi:small-conductance mechanosensitive channel
LATVVASSAATPWPGGFDSCEIVIGHLTLSCAGTSSPAADSPVMKNKLITGCFATLLCTLLLVCSALAQSQQPLAPRASPQVLADNGSSVAPPEDDALTGLVEIEGRPILTVYETLGTHTPAQRAADIEKRIISIARDGSLSPDSVSVLQRESYSWIVVANQTILAVTDEDAKMSGKPRSKLATEYANNIREVIQDYRREHSWKIILRGVLKTTLATTVLVALLWLIGRIRRVVSDRIQRQIRRSASLEKKSAWHVSVAYLGPITLGIGAIIRWIVILALFQAYLTVALGFFSSTREISQTLTQWVTSQLGSLGQAAVDYVPNVFVLAVIVLVTNYAIHLTQLIFGEIEKGELRISGFYSDWAEPTEKLVRMLLIVLALIVAFPYIPGAKTPAFQGISIFLGLLLSLGSSSAVANAIAGVILIYMRSFLVGDWVQIGDTVGEVIEKNLLVTRILTPKDEIITIPNSTVMSGSVKNYSIEAKKAGVIFYTTVTIGYDAPWRTVHELLVKAALATNHVRPQPTPFVLQRGLDDFYVAYELNAYTDVPREMLNILSELRQNIQDNFNDAGMEICSPHFASVRDGNVIAIPRQYVGADYNAPGFRVKPVNGNEGTDLQVDHIKASKPDH